MDCKHCKMLLNQSQYNTERTKKSCPNCSTNNGVEHVYYDYPSEFGTTPLRASPNVPDGAQSYCVACRGNQPITAPQTLCSSL